MFKRATVCVPQVLAAIRPVSTVALCSVRQQQLFLSAPRVSHVNIGQIFIRNFSTGDKEGVNKEEEKIEEEVVEEEDAVNEEKTVEELTEEYEGKLKEMKNNMIRAYADEENVRRIAKRDVENARIYANTKFAKSLLDVADNLERALEAAAKSEVKFAEDCDTTKAFHNLVEGVEMTQNQLTKVFSEHGVVKYGTVGDVFDPEIHDALYKMPDPSKEDGTVGAILKAGYKLNDRVIRAAEVGTIVNS